MRIISFIFFIIYSNLIMANPDQMTQMKWAYDSPRRGAGTTRPFGDFDQAYGGWDIEGEPTIYLEKYQ